MPVATAGILSDRQRDLGSSFESSGSLILGVTLRVLRVGSFRARVFFRVCFCCKFLECAVKAKTFAFVQYSSASNCCFSSKEKAPFMRPLKQHLYLENVRHSSVT